MNSDFAGKHVIGLSVVFLHRTGLLIRRFGDNIGLVCDWNKKKMKIKKKQLVPFLYTKHYQWVSV